jgi:hypothetical protein
MAETTEPDTIKNIERMVILKALEEYGWGAKDKDQRAAIFALKDRLSAAKRIILEPSPTAGE